MLRSPAEVYWLKLSAANGDKAILFRQLATLRTDIKLFDDVDELRWNGPTPAYDAIAAQLDAAVTQPRSRSLKPRSKGERAAGV